MTRSEREDNEQLEHKMTAWNVERFVATLAINKEKQREREIRLA